MTRSAVALALVVITGATFVPAFARADSVSELVQSARAYADRRNDDLAARRYSEALSLDPTNRDAYLGLGALRVRQGDLIEAERVYSVALAHVPQMLDALTERARVRRRLGKNDEARSDLRAATPGETLSALPTLKELSHWYEEDDLLPVALATWRKILSIARTAGQAALVREARTAVLALQALVGRLDPAYQPPDPADPTRLSLAAIARRGG